MAEVKERREEKTEKEKDNRYKEDSRRVGDLE